MAELGVVRHFLALTQTNIAMNRLVITLIAYSASALISLAQNARPIDPPELVTMREEFRLGFGIPRGIHGA